MYKHFLWLVRKESSTTDRDLANIILLLGGFVLGAVSVIAAVCGMVYVFMGVPEMAGALVPYIVLPAAVAIAALWAVSDRKRGNKSR